MILMSNKYVAGKVKNTVVYAWFDLFGMDIRSRAEGRFDLFGRKGGDVFIDVVFLQSMKSVNKS